MRRSIPSSPEMQPVPAVDPYPEAVPQPTGGREPLALLPLLVWRRFWIAACCRLRTPPVELLSTFPGRPSDYAKLCSWREAPARAAADLFFLQLLEQAVGDQFGARVRHPTRLWICTEDFPEEWFASAVRITAASWPGWALDGTDDQPLLDRVDIHFAGPFRACRRGWPGIGDWQVPPR